MNPITMPSELSMAWRASHAQSGCWRQGRGGVVVKTYDMIRIMGSEPIRRGVIGINEIKRVSYQQITYHHWILRRFDSV